MTTECNAKQAAKVAQAIDDNGGDKGVAQALAMTTRGVNKWRNNNRVPPERVPDFIATFGDKHKPYELNPDSHPVWLFEQFTHLDDTAA